jgi:hypothetical protein
MSGEEAMVLGHIQASANEGEFYVSNRTPTIKRQDLSYFI